MDKVKLALKSRTTWSLVAMFLIGGINAVMGVIPAADVVYVQGTLALVAMYFHVNPSQNYVPPTTKD